MITYRTEQTNTSKNTDEILVDDQLTPELTHQKMRQLIISLSLYFLALNFNGHFTVDLG